MRIVRSSGKSNETNLCILVHCIHYFTGCVYSLLQIIETVSDIICDIDFAIQAFTLQLKPVIVGYLVR